MCTITTNINGRECDNINTINAIELLSSLQLYLLLQSIYLALKKKKKKNDDVI